MHERRSCCAIAVAILTVLGLTALSLAGPASNASAGSDLASRLGGTWDGWGTIRLADGTTDKLRCRAVYRGSGGRITETLTCQGRSYRIEGSASFSIAGASVSGTWSESAFGVGGTLAGRADAGGLALELQGPMFTAAYAVALEGCRQSISVRPAGVHVESITATLRNC